MEPTFKFKRVNLNRVLCSWTDPVDHATSIIAQYFDDNGSLVFKQDLSLAEAAKIISEK